MVNCVGLLFAIFLVFSSKEIEFSTAGESCNSNSDCGGNWCCVSNTCIYTSETCTCQNDYDCKPSERCCWNPHGGQLYRCKRHSCTAEFCSNKWDCIGFSSKKCCRSNECVSCSTPGGCRNDDECRRGQYCCKNEQGESICSWSCVGHYCNSDEDCTTSRRQCCIRNKCTTSCIGNECVSDSDCGAAETCTYPVCVRNVTGKPCPKRPARKCFSTNGCFSASDCDIFGTGYYCCKLEKYFPSEQVCGSNCITKFCNEDSGCGDSSECCNISNFKCEACSNFPPWVIGVLVGILTMIVIIAIGYICFRLKKRGREVPSNQLSQPLPTELQPCILLPRSAETENEHGSGQLPDSFVGNMNDKNETVVPSAPPLEPHPSTLTSPPPPSYESLFHNR